MWDEGRIWSEVKRLVQVSITVIVNWPLVHHRTSKLTVSLSRAKKFARLSGSPYIILGLTGMKPHVGSESKHHWHDPVYAVWKDSPPLWPEFCSRPSDHLVSVTTCVTSGLVGIQGMRRSYGSGTGPNRGTVCSLWREQNYSPTSSYQDNLATFILILIIISYLTFSLKTGGEMGVCY